MRLAPVAIMLGLAGCSTLVPNMPGSIVENKSEYDGTVQISMIPGWANDGFTSSLKIGARRTSKMDPGKILLIVENTSIKNFSFDHPNFFMKIDGKEIALSPISRETSCHLSGTRIAHWYPAHCYQEYEVSIFLIEKMLAGKDVRFKLDLSGNTYTEGNLNLDQHSTARPGLREFVKRIKGKSVVADAAKK